MRRSVAGKEGSLKLLVGRKWMLFWVFSKFSMFSSKKTKLTKNLNLLKHFSLHTFHFQLHTSL